MYERSYMHRDVVSHAVMTPCGTDFLVTASQDGHIKFWKKMPEGVEFVKHFHSHLEPIHDLAVRDVVVNYGKYVVLPGDMFRSIIKSNIISESEHVCRTFVPISV